MGKPNFILVFPCYKIKFLTLVWSFNSPSLSQYKVVLPKVGFKMIDSDIIFNKMAFICSAFGNNKYSY